MQYSHKLSQGLPFRSSACSDGYLKVYLRGQEATDSYDKHDAELCGEGASSPPFPAPLLSDGPRLVMVFSSGELQGRGFKAKYTFETGKLAIWSLYRFILRQEPSMREASLYSPTLG